MRRGAVRVHLVSQQRKVTQLRICLLFRNWSQRADFTRVFRRFWRRIAHLGYLIRMFHSIRVARLRPTLNSVNRRRITYQPIITRIPTSIISDYLSDWPTSCRTCVPRIRSFDSLGDRDEQKKHANA